ncbi:MAG: TonB-dependent receptor [Tannerella sp.]|jgi:TonB-linked SusC/RagA family outer membrane protein|nr:TonB-dependent receptor [Tannerella sp.]
MKKKSIEERFASFSNTNLLRKMKIVVFFIAVAVCHISATNSYAQKTEITLRVNNVTLREAIRSIEKQTEFVFFYSNDKIDLDKKVSFDIEKGTITDVLKQISDDYTYIVENKQILLMPADSRKADEITGLVVDKDGEPVIGASVVEKGTTNGTTTDIEGNFTLNVGPNAVLRISYIGYVVQEIAVKDKRNVVVTLIEDTQVLEEVVVIGYGTMQRKDLTGAVSSINAETLKERPVPSVGASLQGKLSGAMVQETGGDLTGRFQFSIRGTGSVTGSNDPLIVVDGIPLFNSDLSTINQKDIVSVDILKDASATAIYGARASNGVVIITTERGKVGRPVVTFNMDIGFENIAKRYEVLTTEQQRQLFVEGFKNTNRNPAVYEDTTNPVWQIQTDWQKLGTQTGVRQTYNLSINGGSESNKYAISGSYRRRLGIMKNTDLDEFSLRANNDISIGKKLKVATSLGGTYQDQNLLENDKWGTGAYQRLVSSHTYLPAYDENGDLFAVSTTADPYFGENSNPLIDQLLPTNKQNTTRIMGSIKADYDIIDGLTLTANAGADVASINGYQYLPVYEIGRYTRTQGSTTKINRQTVNWVTDLTLQYKKKWKEHSLTLLAGASAQKHVLENTNTVGTGTIDNFLDQLSNQTSFSATGTSVTSSLLSTFFRFNYGYKDRYLLTGTLRRDGSSKFGADKRYGVFPSVSAAWRVSEESFLSDADILNNLKLRVGYGVTGNQDIGDFAFLTRAGATPYVWGNTLVVGNSPVNMGNSQLQWESAKQFNVGVDVSLIKDRISFVLDYYNKKSEDLLIQIPVPYTASVTENPYVNLGSLRNRGIEFNLTTRNLTGKFSWTTDFNISFNENKVLDIGRNALGEPLQIPGANISLPNDFVNLTMAGKTVGAFYMYEFIGIWQKDEAEEAALFGAVPGDPKYADLNNSKSLDTEDKKFVGSPLPKYFGGFTNTFSYGPFSLNVFFNFAGGNKLYNAMRNLNARAVPFNQQLAEVADFWTEDNPSNTVPRPSQGGNTTFLATRTSTRYLEDAKYLRLKNLSLSYTLPHQFLSKINSSSAVVTVNATNLVTFTKYKGLDPEALSTSSLLSGGIDYTPYPSTRFYSLSLLLL